MAYKSRAWDGKTKEARKETRPRTSVGGGVEPTRTIRNCASYPCPPGGGKGRPVLVSPARCVEDSRRGGRGWQFGCTARNRPPWRTQRGQNGRRGWWVSCGSPGAARMDGMVWPLFRPFPGRRAVPCEGARTRLRLTWTERGSSLRFLARLGTYAACWGGTPTPAGSCSATRACRSSSCLLPACRLSSSSSTHRPSTSTTRVGLGEIQMRRRFRFGLAATDLRCR